PAALRGGAKAAAGATLWVELWGIGGDAGENAIVGLHLLFVCADDGVSAVFAMNEDGSPRAEGEPLQVGDSVRLSYASGPGQRARRPLIRRSAGVELEIDEAAQTGDRVEHRVRVAHAVGEGRVEAFVAPHPELHIPVSGYAAPTRYVLSAFGTLWDPRRPVAERQAAFQAGMRLAEAARRQLTVVGPEGLKLRRQTDLEGLTRYVLIADVAGDQLGPLAGLEPGDATVIGDERAFVISVG
ncbi:MAG: hypothetical protein H6740_26300, partial [Alphaproteobacteria bacterium]|nr:hypothetical protein [Alphaproteobacteria bacterium]